MGLVTPALSDGETGAPGGGSGTVSAGARRAGGPNAAARHQRMAPRSITPCSGPASDPWTPPDTDPLSLTLSRRVVLNIA